SGGYIHYCEYPKLTHNIKALEAVWDYSYDKISYLGTNIPIDHCRLCDFKGDFKTTKTEYQCPDCVNNDPKKVDEVKKKYDYYNNRVKIHNKRRRQKEVYATIKSKKEH